jgi:hypothetical protein
MSTTNPVKVIGSKLWMQTKITYWKLRFVTTDLLKNTNTYNFETEF